MVPAHLQETVVILLVRRLCSLQFPLVNLFVFRDAVVIFGDLAAAQAIDVSFADRHFLLVVENYQKASLKLVQVRGGPQILVRVHDESPLHMLDVFLQLASLLQKCLFCDQGP